MTNSDNNGNEPKPKDELQNLSAEEIEFLEKLKNQMALEDGESVKLYALVAKRLP